jgi:hypothetical protein
MDAKLVCQTVRVALIYASLPPQIDGLPLCLVAISPAPSGPRSSLVLLTVDFGTPSYKFTINICTYLIF